LGKLSLIRPRIYFCENISGFDLLAVGESNALQVAIDARLHVDGVKGHHRTKSRALDL
jgi:hypothetical protein